MRVYTVLLLLITGTLASFNRLTCSSQNECVIPTSNGGFCYNPNQSNRPREESVCRTGSRQNVMAVHIASSTSIGYYDRQTYERLGDYAYKVIRPVYLCTSGQLTDGSYQSVCSSVSEDNNVAGVVCAVAIGQPYLDDGCYTRDSRPVAIQVAQSVGSPGAQSIGSTGIVSAPPSVETGNSSPPIRNYASHLSVPSIATLLFLLAVTGTICRF